MHTYTIEQAAAFAERVLGENLMFLTDTLAPHIRAGDKRVLLALAQIEEAHTNLCKAGAHKLPLPGQTLSGT